jgi:hypothetical protein
MLSPLTNFFRILIFEHPSKPTIRGDMPGVSQSMVTPSVGFPVSGDRPFEYLS